MNNFLQKVAKETKKILKKKKEKAMRRFKRSLYWLYISHHVHIYNKTECNINLLVQPFSKLFSVTIILIEWKKGGEDGDYEIGFIHLIMVHSKSTIIERNKYRVTNPFPTLTLCCLHLPVLFYFSVIILLDCLNNDLLLL